MKRESVEELVKARKGYKYLNQDRTSPYQNYKYVFKKGKVFKTDILDQDSNHECGVGWNLATLDWIIQDTNIFDKIIVEFSIPKKAKIVIPLASSGKFRTDIIRYERIWKSYEIFPALKKITTRLKKYKPINPIVATKMPPVKKLKSILAQVRDQIGDQIWAQVLSQVGAQVGAQIWAQVETQVRAQVWDQIWDQVRTQVGTQVRDQVRTQVRAQVRAQIRTQVWYQVWIIGYYAIKLFTNVPFEHPVFELIRLGILVIEVMEKIKVFGKNGKFLGEFDE